MTLALQLTALADALMILGFLLYGAVVAHVDGKRYRKKVRESMYKVG